jgi:hypothetical protein
MKKTEWNEKEWKASSKGKYCLLGEILVLHMCNHGKWLTD